MVDKKIEMFILGYKNPVCKWNNQKQYFELMCGSNNYECNDGRLVDNVGDNISYKNKFYSELTGIYWVWKNTQ